MTTIKPATTTTTTTTPTVVVTPTPAPTAVVKPTTPATPAAPSSTTYAPAPAGNWIGALIGFIWVYLINYVYLALISWWWIPIDSILFGNWTDFYTFFISNSASFGSYVQSYSLTINP